LLTDGASPGSIVERFVLLDNAALAAIAGLMHRKNTSVDHEFTLM
jgi:hypothetical protein